MSEPTTDAELRWMWEQAAEAATQFEGELAVLRAQLADVDAWLRLAGFQGQDRTEAVAHMARAAMPTPRASGGRRMTRHPTAAHPWCTCTPHQHGDGQCAGTAIIYELPDGTLRDGPCLILGQPINPSSRHDCPIHGEAA